MQTYESTNQHGFLPPIYTIFLRARPELLDCYPTFLWSDDPRSGTSDQLLLRRN
jgi:hypothetical protein